VDFELDLPRAGRVFLFGNSTVRTVQLNDTTGTDAATDDPTLARADCELTVDGSALAGSHQTVAEEDSGGVQAHFRGQNLTTGTISGVLDPGVHTFALRCTDTDGNMDFEDTQLVAVSLDDD
jgi:hypothetical protein